MLTDLFQSLSNYLSELDIPVYLADCVPQGASLPYITAEIKAPLSPQAEGLLTLICWQHGTSANTARLSAADDLLSLLPARGAFLPTLTGSMILRQESTSLCVREAGLLGVKNAWKLRFLPSM